jgi:hypothetical protein
MENKKCFDIVDARYKHEDDFAGYGVTDVNIYSGSFSQK